VRYDVRLKCACTKRVEGSVLAWHQMRSADVVGTVEEATERWRWLNRKTRLAAAAAERGHDATAMAKEMFSGWVRLRTAAM